MNDRDLSPEDKYARELQKRNDERMSALEAKTQKHLDDGFMEFKGKLASQDAASRKMLEDARRSLNENIDKFRDQSRQVIDKFERDIQSFEEKAQKRLSSLATQILIIVIVLVVGGVTASTFTATKAVHESVLKLQDEMIDAQKVIQESSKEVVSAQETLKAAQADLEITKAEYEKRLTELERAQQRPAPR